VNLYEQSLSTHKNKYPSLHRSQSAAAKNLSAFKEIKVYYPLCQSTQANPGHNHFNTINVTHYPCDVPIIMLSVHLWVFQVVFSPKLYRQEFFSPLLIVLLILSVNLTPLQRQTNCYGFSESCSRYVLALHVAMWETHYTLVWTFQKKGS
jgi:hypothetical protein